MEIIADNPVKTIKPDLHSKYKGSIRFIQSWHISPKAKGGKPGEQVIAMRRFTRSAIIRELAPYPTAA